MPVMERRQTTPQELADPEDCVVNESSEDSSGADEEAAMLALHENPTALPLPEGLPPQTWAQRNLSTLPIEARNVLAGGLAGMVAKSFVAPLDRIKILYQVSSAKFHVWQLPTVVRNIVENEGLAALWKGNFATMIRVFPYSGVQFMVFDRCKLLFLREHEERGRYLSILPPAAQQRRKYGLTPSESLVAGMVAGTLSVLVTYPLDLTRAQLAVLRRHRDGSPTRSFVGVLGDNYRHRGLAGLFRGITPTLLGILPYSGVAFTLNEQGKREIQHVTGRDLTTMERMQCGAFSGLVAQTITYPIEVTRRRMQTLGLVGTDTAFGNLGVVEGVAAKGPPTLASTVRTLYAEQGMRGFFKGVSMNWMKGPVAFSISFTAYDTVKAMMATEAEKSQRIPLLRKFSLRPPSAAPKA